MITLQDGLIVNDNAPSRKGSGSAMKGRLLGALVLGLAAGCGPTSSPTPLPTVVLDVAAASDHDEGRRVR